MYLYCRILIPFILIVNFNLATKLTAQCFQGESESRLGVNELTVYNNTKGNIGSSFEFGVVDDISGGIPKPDWISSMWIGGVNEDGDLLLNGFEFDQHCFWPGPFIENGSNSEKQESCTNWDVIFEVTGEDILLFKEIIENNTEVDIDDIPSSIKGWPAKGNQLFIEQFDFALPLQNLAPFVDVDGDGQYNPLKGDYPDINNASIAQWWILNTGGGINSCNATSNLNAEIQVMTYAYSSTSPILNSSVFHDLTIVQKDNQVVDNAYFSFWQYISSCPSRHFVGSIPDDNLAFFYEYRDSESPYCLQYNEDFQFSIVGLKQLSGPLAPRVFNENDDLIYPEIGMLADTFVEQKMSSVKHYYSALQSDVEPFETDPWSGAESYNYMQGLWRDGSDQLVNGVPSKFAYPGNPANPMEGDFPMCNEDRDFIDLRVLSSSGPFRMEPESRHKFTYVRTRMPIENVACPDVSELVDGLKRIEDLVDDFTLSSKANLLKFNGVNVFPNPANAKIIFQLDDPNRVINSIEVMDLMGRVVRHVEDLSQLQFELSLSDLLPGAYAYKLICNHETVHSGKFIKQY